MSIHELDRSLCVLFVSAAMRAPKVKAPKVVAPPTEEDERVSAQAWQRQRWSLHARWLTRIAPLLCVCQKSAAALRASFAVTRAEVDALGSTALSKWDRKVWQAQEDAAQGLKPLKGTKAPLKMFLGMEAKKEERAKRKRDAVSDSTTSPSRGAAVIAVLSLTSVVCFCCR